MNTSGYWQMQPIFPPSLCYGKCLSYAPSEYDSPYALDVITRPSSRELYSLFLPLLYGHFLAPLAPSHQLQAAQKSPILKHLNPTPPF